MNTLGVVLAGGPGSRMGGGKPLVTMGGRRLVDIACHKMAQVCPEVVVLAADLAQVADLPHTVIRDRWPGQGPMNGVITAFLDTDAPALMVLAVDYPLVPVPVLAAVRAAGEAHGLAAAPQGPNYAEPLMAWYSREVLPVCQRYFQEGRRTLWRVLDEVGARVLSRQELAPLDPQGHGFLNVNRPQDLELARRLAGDCGP